MRDREELLGLLERIDGRGYKAYKGIEGTWSFPDFVLHIDHVQGDPFADPTRLRVKIPPTAAGFEPGAFRSRPRALGTSAFLASAFSEAARSASARLGSGRSGEIRMEHPGQTVLAQTAVRVDEQGGVEARFRVGLPATGRRVLGRQASRIIGETLPELVGKTLVGPAHDPRQIERHAATNEDATALRHALAECGLIAFVADGSLLPRRSGVDDRPLGGQAVVPFASPESMRRTVEVPNRGAVTGMGVPPGVTLVVGGGFHGKSTLLRALEAGVYNHRPGDGRELVVTRADAVKIRAEDGRSVTAVNISPFIDGLPLGRGTHRFSTPNASGSTSQAAAIIEALEAGAGALFVDEDTSATNFMIRDRRMQRLVPGEGEPITPFVDRVRSLYDRCGVSCVLVIGGSGDYLDVADRVVRMSDYRPEDVTARAREVARSHPTGRESEGGPDFSPPAPRSVRVSSLDPRRGSRAAYVKVPDDRTLLFGGESIDLVAVEQFSCRAQIRAVGLALVLLSRRCQDRVMTVPEALDFVGSVLEEGGLDALDERLVGELAEFRPQELAAALNRLRTLHAE